MRLRRSIAKVAPETVEHTHLHINGEVQLLRVEPGDTIIVSLDGHPSVKCIGELSDHMRARFPDNIVLVVTDEIHIEISETRAFAAAPGEVRN